MRTFTGTFSGLVMALGLAFALTLGGCSSSTSGDTDTGGGGGDDIVAATDTDTGGGTADDADGGSAGDGVTPQPAGPVVAFTEFMRGPCDMSDSDGEWIEVLNVSNEAVSLEGWQLAVDTKSHTLAAPEENPGLLTLEPGEYLALAKSADAFTLDAFYVYSGLTLGGDDDVLTLFDGTGAVVDTVSFGEGWPDVDCASVQLSGDKLTAADNDLAPNWCPGTTVYGTDQDMGTPGAANTLCLPCGNGVEDDGEACDDGAENSDTTPNACREDCTLPRCGDGVVDDAEDFGEACDEGEDVNSDTEPNTCRTDCSLPICGDGVVDDASPYDEQCDDEEGCGDDCRWIPPTCPPPAGALVITELMNDPTDTGDTGEWIEIYNAGGEQYGLQCCTIIDGPDAESDAHALVLDNVEPGRSLTLDPGAYWVIARRGAEDMSPASPDYVFNLSLGNTNDTVAIVCDGVEIDRVDYGAGWPDEAGRSMTLTATAFDAASNDVADNWCTAKDDNLYDAEGGNYGTPGGPNPDCFDVVDACYLAGPPTVAYEAGASAAVSGRVKWLPATAGTTGTDEDERIVGQLGWGPDGSSPMGNGDWTWTAAAANGDWVDTDAPEFDEYVADLSVPLTGEWDYAYRFSADGGVTWIYCDQAPGSEDGYDAADAGALTVTTNPTCDPNPCTEELAPTCADATHLLVREGEGVCTVPDAAQPDVFACAYTDVPTECPAETPFCIDGACIAEEPIPPLAGEVIVTEFMARSQSGSDPGEWVELYNTTDGNLNLNGCSVAGATFDELVVIGPGQSLLIAKNGDAAVNHGLPETALVPGGLSLPNDGTTIELLCGETSIDAVTYTGDVVMMGQALQLMPSAYDATLNDDLENWCGAGETYGPEGLFGTPGAMNPECPVLLPDWCRLQYVSHTLAVEGQTVEAYGRVWEPGVTDLTDLVDDGPMQGQVGFGPVDSNPDVDDTGWLWFDAMPNPDWNAQEAMGGAEPGNDEYLAALTVPIEGLVYGEEYAVAFRFSIDGGAAWLVCDMNADEGSDGSEDGYQPENAGSLTTGPDPCVDYECPPAADAYCDEDGVTLIVPTTTCVVDETTGEPTCPTEDMTVDCSPGACTDGACDDLRPAVGDVIFTEIMPDPHYDLTDSDGEWFELTVLAEYNVVLDGCVITDDADNSVTIEGLSNLAPGAHILFAVSDDPTLNGGLVPHHLFGFGLGNTSDTLTLTCPLLQESGETVDTVIDTFAWSDELGFDIGRAHSLSLDADAYDATSNDDPANWCDSRTVYYEGSLGAEENNFGTPGAPNAACPDYVANWCRLQWPVDAEVDAGDPVTVYGRVWEPGFTDITTGVDEGVVAGQVGFGPDGTDPASDASWTWVDATPNPDWDGAAATPVAEPDNDEYQATFTAPAPGVYDHAFRFTLDGGATWLYCDRDAGEGSDGSEDGYQVENAGSLTSQGDPCADLVCDQIPAPACDADGVTLITYEAGCEIDPGTGEASCVYPEAARTDCSPNTCAGGVCTGSPAIGEGDLVITEIMYDPHDGLGDADAEFIEIYNATATELALDGCTIAENSGGSTSLDGLTVAAGGYLLLVKKDDTTINGGLTPDATFSFSCANTSESLTITCDGTPIDVVAYDEGEGWPRAQAASISLNSAALDAESNDDPANWCIATDVYWVGDPTAEEADNYGTPGTANPECDTVVDWCRLQWPAEATPAAADDFEVYGRVFEEGITDRSEFVDASPVLWASAGYGPDGTDPATDPDWVWTIASGNDGWNGNDAVPTPEPNNDEYVATVTAPETGEYDLAFRFSLDGGRTWLYCDLNGTDDGYTAEEAGRLAPTSSVCSPDPCTTPDEPVCLDDGVTLRTFDLPATCEDVAGVAECTYAFTDTDCSTNGGTCSAGACVGGSEAPLQGEVIFTEVMYDPHNGLSDGDAEWFELYNVSGAAVSLEGCTLAENGGGNTVVGALLLAAGERALFVKTDDTSINGNLTPVQTFAFSLANSSESLTLTCGGTIIDTISWDESNGWPNANAASLSLSPAHYDADDNDLRSSWCLGADVYWSGAEGDNLGTPGTANPDCPVLDFTIDFCRLQWPEAVEDTAGQSYTFYGRLWEDGLTGQSTAVDSDGSIDAEFGYGPDGALPDAIDGGWIWTDAYGNPGWNASESGAGDEDEYQADVTLPAAGTYDYAFRFRRNGGDWLYCDLGEGSTDGYSADTAGAMTTTAGETNNLFFSEYVEGSSNNKAIEIYNAEAEAVALDGCQLVLYGNGATTPSGDFDLAGNTIAAGDVLVLCNSSFSEVDRGLCDILTGTVNFNGDDAVALVCGGTPLDVIGVIGERPSFWGSGDTTTKDDTIRRLCTVAEGDGDGFDIADDITAQWSGHAQDDFSDLGQHCLP